MLTIDNPSKFDWANMALSDCAEGNAMDTYFTLKLYDLLMEKLEGDPVLKLVTEVLMPSLELFSEVEYNGIDIDVTALDTVGKALASTNMDLEDSLYGIDVVSPDDNLSSNADLQKILYTGEDCLELYPPDKTTKGAPSVSAPTLKLLLDQINEELQSRE